MNVLWDYRKENRRHCSHSLLLRALQDLHDRMKSLRFQEYTMVMVDDKHVNYNQQFVKMKTIDDNSNYLLVNVRSNSTQRCCESMLKHVNDQNPNHLKTENENKKKKYFYEEKKTYETKVGSQRNNLTGCTKNTDFAHRRSTDDISDRNFCRRQKKTCEKNKKIG